MGFLNRFWRGPGHRRLLVRRSDAGRARPAVEVLERRLVPSYTVTDLGTLGGTLSYGIGINSQGEAVGASDLECNCSTRGFLWGQGSLHRMEVEGNFGINDLGQVVGDTLNGHPFRWSRQDGMTTLDFEGQPNAVNNQGEFAGQISATAHAFLWTQGNVVDLGAIGTSGVSTAVGLNDHGQVVGQTGGRAFLWTADRGMRDIGSLDGDPYSTSAASAINDRGQIVGTSYSNPLHTSHAAYYGRSGVIDLGTLGSYSSAEGLNSQGQVVGESFAPAGTHAFLTDLSGGPMIDLNSLIPPSLGWTLYDARAINDAGQIVGSAKLPGDNVIHAYLLTPDPFAVPALLTAAFSPPEPTVNVVVPLPLPEAQVSACPFLAGLGNGGTPADGSRADEGGRPFGVLTASDGGACASRDGLPSLFGASGLTDWGAPEGRASGCSNRDRPAIESLYATASWQAPGCQSQMGSGLRSGLGQAVSTG